MYLILFAKTTFKVKTVKVEVKNKTLHWWLAECDCEWVKDKQLHRGATLLKILIWVKLTLTKTVRDANNMNVFFYNQT